MSPAAFRTSPSSSRSPSRAPSSCSPPCGNGSSAPRSRMVRQPKSIFCSSSRRNAIDRRRHSLCLRFGPDRHRGSGHPLSLSHHRHANPHPAVPGVEVSRDAFRTECKISQVRTHSFAARPPDLRRFPWSLELRGHVPARPGRQRILSGSCSSAAASLHACSRHSVTPMPLRFARSDLLTAGLTPAECAHAGGHENGRGLYCMPRPD